MKDPAVLFYFQDFLVGTDFTKTCVFSIKGVYL